MTEAPRPYTEEETKARFLEHVRAIVRYWSKPSVRAEPNERIEGVAFSILSTLDGSALNLPGFRVMPNPHPTDEPYHRERGENWYDPEVDVAGSLHERFCPTPSEAVRDVPESGITPEMRVLAFAQQEQDARQKRHMLDAAVACIRQQYVTALASADLLNIPRFTALVLAIPGVSAAAKQLNTYAKEVVALADKETGSAALSLPSGLRAFSRGPFARLYDIAAHIEEGTRAVAWVIYQHELPPEIQRFASRAGEGVGAWLSYVSAYAEADRCNRQYTDPK